MNERICLFTKYKFITLIVDFIFHVAIELNPTYLKALIRRAQLHKKMDNLERALEDYQKIVELDRNNAEARAACMVRFSEYFYFFIA